MVSGLGAVALLAFVVLPGCEEESGKPIANPPVKEGVSRGQINRKKGEEFLAENKKKAGRENHGERLAISRPQRGDREKARAERHAWSATITAP